MPVARLHVGPSGEENQPIRMIVKNMAALVGSEAVSQKTQFEQRGSVLFSTRLKLVMAVLNA